MTSQPGIDGISGLGITMSAPPPPPQSLQWVLHDAGLLESGIFGLYTPSGQVTGRELTPDGVDETRFGGELTWFPLDFLGDTAWTVDVQAIFRERGAIQVFRAEATPQTGAARSPTHRASSASWIRGLPSFCLRRTPRPRPRRSTPKFHPKSTSLILWVPWGCACRREVC